MTDPFLDLIERSIENGDVPQRVTNRHLYAAIKMTYTEQGKQGTRLSLVERWQYRANGVAAAVGAGGLIITILKTMGVL